MRDQAVLFPQDEHFELYRGMEKLETPQKATVSMKSITPRTEKTPAAETPSSRKLPWEPESWDPLWRLRRFNPLNRDPLPLEHELVQDECANFQKLYRVGSVTNFFRFMSDFGNDKDKLFTKVDTYENENIRPDHYLRTKSIPLPLKISTIEQKDPNLMRVTEMMEKWISLKKQQKAQQKSQQIPQNYGVPQFWHDMCGFACALTIWQHAITPEPQDLNTFQELLKDLYLLLTPGQGSDKDFRKFDISILEKPYNESKNKFFALPDAATSAANPGSMTPQPYRMRPEFRNKNMNWTAPLARTLGMTIENGYAGIWLHMMCPDDTQIIHEEGFAKDIKLISDRFSKCHVLIDYGIYDENDISSDLTQFQNVLEKLFEKLQTRERGRHATVQARRRILALIFDLFNKDDETAGHSVTMMPNVACTTYDCFDPFGKTPVINPISHSKGVTEFKNAFIDAVTLGFTICERVTILFAPAPKT